VFSPPLLHRELKSTRIRGIYLRQTIAGAIRGQDSNHLPTQPIPSSEPAGTRLRVTPALERVKPWVPALLGFGVSELSMTNLITKLAYWGGGGQGGGV